MLRKGQTATEYIVIVAVVIVIAVIVISVLGGIPSIGGGAKTNTLAAYWKTADISITNFNVDANGYAYLYFRNSIPQSITIISLESCSDQACSTITGINNIEYQFKVGQASTIGIADINITPISAGDKFNFYLRINYTDSFGNSKTLLGVSPLSGKYSNN
jgi:hypothetical protein